LQDSDDEQKMAMLRKAFQMFDTTKCGYIDVLKISTILNTMGQLFDDSELQALIDENDPEGKLKIYFSYLRSLRSLTYEGNIMLIIPHILYFS
jgi:calmodulin